MAAFWLIAFFILTGLGATLGIPSQVTDDFSGKAWVQILVVAPESPAAAAGLVAGDVIEGFRIREGLVEITTVSQVQELTESHAGQDVIMNVLSGKDRREVTLNIRERVPAGHVLH